MNIIHLTAQNLSRWILDSQIPRDERLMAVEELKNLNSLYQFLQDKPVTFPTFEELIILPEEELNNKLLELLNELSNFSEQAFLLTNKTEKNKIEDFQVALSHLKQAYSSSLQFGTAGLRSTMGAGYNRMNKYMLMVAAEALAMTLKGDFSKQDCESRPIVIGHDARHNSREFCQTVAATLAANGFKVYVSPDYCPTPLIAYLVRPFNALCGLMLTASHNTGEYNGMKLYAEDGIQSDEIMAGKVAQHMEEVLKSSFHEANFDSFKKSGLIEVIKQEHYDSYFDAIRDELRPEGQEDELRIAYTPVHGVGAKFILPLFESLGYKNVFTVTSELNPDPDFTDIPRPNPEYEETLAKLKKVAEDNHCHIALATDPDADRFALMLPDENSNFVMMTGNDTAALLIDYYADYLNTNNLMPQRPVLVKSIVSDFFAAAVADSKGIELCESLTGFKNICGKRRLFLEDSEPKREYIMGFEESIGFALGDSVRDKDGLRTACYMLKAALRMHKQGKTLYDRYIELSEALLYHASRPIQIEKEGLEGQEFIKQKMIEFRSSPIQDIASHKLTILEDYSDLSRKVYKKVENDIVLDHEERIDEFKQNALRYFYEDGIFFALRPSGTEPKIKFYLYTVGKSKKEANELLDELEKVVTARLK